MQFGETKQFKWREAPKLPSLERIDGPDYRLYKDAEGLLYPSVTSVLNVHPKPELEAWKKRVGEEESARVSSRATTRGTKIHDLCERYLANRPVKGITDPLTFAEWIPLKRQLDLHVDNIVGSELFLHSKRLMSAGATDLIAEWDGELCLIDFKTSTRFKERSEIESYFIQTCAYCMFYYELTGIPIRKTVILMLVDGGQCITFEQKASDYIQGFLDLRKAFKEKNGF